MSLENVKDPYTALFILKWLEQNKQKFFGDVSLTESDIISLVEKYIEDNKDELKGDDGETPQHRWVGTKLQFKNPDGSWGKLVDLKGPRGGGWFGGGGSGTSPQPSTEPLPGTINYNEDGQIESILKGTDQLTTFIRDEDSNIYQVVKPDYTKTFIRNEDGAIIAWQITNT